jgi:hypothetical protein
VGVDQAAGGLRLAQQALAAVGDLRRLVGSDADRLDGQQALDLGVLGQVDDPHRSRAESAQDAVAADRPSARELGGHVRRRLRRFPAAV